MWRRIDEVLATLARHIGIASALVVLGGSLFVLLLLARSFLSQ